VWGEGVENMGNLEKIASQHELSRIRKFPENRAQSRFPRKPHIYVSTHKYSSEQSRLTRLIAAQRCLNRCFSGLRTEFSDLPQKVVKIQSPKNPRSRKNARDTGLTKAEQNRGFRNGITLGRAPIAVSRHRFENEHKWCSKGGHRGRVRRRTLPPHRIYSVV